MECANCGHGITSPFPDQTSYDTAYFRQRYAEPLRPGSREFLRRIRQEAHRVRFVRKHQRQGRLLDIGCGPGYFLYAAAKAGFMVNGSDITESNAPYITTELGLPFYHGRLEQLDFPPAFFDVITLWHTLEHHPDPRQSLRQCMAWLRQDGILAVEVPNHASLDARRYGAAWPNWDLPFHLHHFSAASLRLLTAAMGLRIIAEKNYHSEYIKDRLRRTIVLRPLARLIARAFAGGSILVACRKNS